MAEMLDDHFAPDGEIIVTGEQQGYVAIDAAALKTNTPLLDTPQSISIFTREQLDDQAFQDIADLLRYTAGASTGQGEGHRDQLTMPGQDTTADFFLDGLRDDVQYFRPFYNVQRIEILKGANALLFGRGGGGGVINRVTKSPVADDNFADVGASIDSFGAYVLNADINAAIGDGAALRLNAVHDRFDNHRDLFDGERFAINPSFGAQLNDNSRLQLSYEYIDDDRVVDRGIPSFGNAPVAGFRDTFFGVPDVNRTTLRAHIATLRVEHELTENLHFDSSARYANYDKLYSNIFPAGANLPAQTVTLDGYLDATTRENVIVQGNLVWDGATGGIGHTLLAGYELGSQASTNSRRDVLFADSGSNLITVPLTDPIAQPSLGFPVLNRNRASQLDFLSFYLQDQIKLTGWLELVGGVRYDRFDISVNDIAGAAQFQRVDEKFSPRFGVIFKPRANLSLYASYAKTFLPRSGEQFLVLSASTANLAPETFENIEFGVKWDIADNLNLTAAVFQLDRDNQSFAIDDRGNSQFGGSRTKGVEAQLTGNILPQWQVSVGYSYLDATESGRLLGGAFVNQPIGQVPENMAFVWTRYDISDAFGIGAGATYQSSQLARTNSSVIIPGYTRVDAAAYYKLNQKVEVQLNVENLFDAGYFPSAHNANNISTGEPINARLTLKVAF
ncbi:MAG: TonB-dependent siderophore receptor [Parasphingorhabdus sp.]|nr:TonB-dependent siderophore receptor [Parasphingorhabdus sp.]